ncbi:hypothetical protein RB595_008157 [Gaeumannomyces hyphopodioides]
MAAETTGECGNTRIRMASQQEIQDLLKKIRIELTKCIRHFVASDISCSFTCTSDLNRVWDDSHLRALFAGALPEGQLDEAQLAHLRNNALPLLSFAVYLNIIPWDWFVNTFPRKAFREAGQPNPQLALILSQEACSPKELKESVEKFIEETIDRNDFNKLYYFIPPTTLRFTNEAEEPIKIYGTCGLPIETQENPMSETGSYGHVYFGRVHPENVLAYPYNHYQAFRPPCAVAVKVFTRRLEEALREVENLRHLKDVASNPDGRYPISLHHAIIHNYASKQDQVPRPMVIFPFAELGNLWQFLNGSCAVGDVDGTFQFLSFDQRFPALASSSQGTTVITGEELRTRLLEQCLALAGALRFLHGRIEHRDMIYLLAHMDLKPNNIIISSHPSSPVGVWKLADFGISVIRRLPLESRKAGVDPWGRPAPATIDTTAQRGASTYQAPEVTFSWNSEIRKENPVGVGRMSDIWSFGAIMAEVLAFAVGGTNEFKAFHEHRRGRVSEDAIGDSDFFWEVLRRSVAGSSTAGSHNSRNESNLLPFQPYSQPSEAEGSDQTYPAQVRPGVVQWLANIESSNPDCAPWVQCIREALKVNPKDRPSAEELFSSVQGVLYPHKERTPDTEPRPEPDVGEGDARPRTPSPKPPDGPTPSSPPWSPDTTPTIPSPQSPIPPDQYDSSSTPPPTKVVLSRALLGFINKICTDARSVCVDHSKIVYLTKSKVHVVGIHEESVEPPNRPLNPSYEQPLPQDGNDKIWKGIASAGDYVILYGHEQPKPKSLLSKTPPPGPSVIRLLQLGGHNANNSHTHGDPWIPLGPRHSDAVANFDFSKRVAVSPDGLIVLIAGNGKDLLILDANRAGFPAVDTVPRGLMTDPNLIFQDASFSEDGRILYAAGVGGPSYTLVAYDASQQGFPLLAKAIYRLDDTSLSWFKNRTLLFPHHPGLGCTVATKKFARILGCPLEASAQGRLQGLGQTPFKPQPHVLAVHNGRLLLTVDSHGSLVTYALSEAVAPGLDGRPTTQLGPATKNVRQFSKTPYPGSQLRVFDDAGATLVLLCHVDGLVEVAKISPPI